jgi:hypothetical protein
MYSSTFKDLMSLGIWTGIKIFGIEQLPPPPYATAFYYQSPAVLVVHTITSHNLY